MRLCDFENFGENLFKYQGVTLKELHEILPKLSYKIRQRNAFVYSCIKEFENDKSFGILITPDREKSRNRVSYNITFPNHSSQKATNWQAGLGTSKYNSITSDRVEKKKQNLPAFLMFPLQ